MDEVRRLAAYLNDTGMSLLDASVSSSDWEKMRVFLHQFVTPDRSLHPEIVSFQEKLFRQAIDYCTQAPSSDDNTPCLTWLRDYLNNPHAALNDQAREKYLLMLLNSCKHHTTDDCFLSLVPMYYDTNPCLDEGGLVFHLLLDGQQEKVLKYMPKHVFPLEEFLNYGTLFTCFVLSFHPSFSNFFSVLSRLPQTKDEEERLAQAFCMKIGVESHYHTLSDKSVDVLLQKMEEAPSSFQDLFWNNVIELSLDENHTMNQRLINHAQKVVLKSELGFALKQKPTLKVKKI